MLEHNAQELLTLATAAVQLVRLLRAQSGFSAWPRLKKVARRERRAVVLKLGTFELRLTWTAE